MRRNRKSPAGIQYIGLAGITTECKDAVMRLLQFNDRINRVRILSSPTHGNHGSRSHCLLLTVNEHDLVAVKSGFASGYSGEGPGGLAFVLQLLRDHGADIDEFYVDEEVIDRCDQSSLTEGDIERIDTAKPVRPTRWYEYLDRNLYRDHRTVWQEFPPIVPFSLIDSRITDLALKFFESPDKHLLTGYRRLEDIVRKRTGIDDHGVKLFSEAFHGEKAKLGWVGLSDNERTGRANLFTGAYMAYRNPRAHYELEHHIEKQMIEFMLLNHLFTLEKDSVEREEQIAKKGASKK